MLVWISSGIVDIKQSLEGIMLDNERASENIYKIKVLPDYDSTTHYSLVYNDREQRDLDFQVLKDALVCIKIRNNVLLYNPPNGVSGIVNDRGSVRRRDSGEIPF